MGKKQKIILIFSKYYLPAYKAGGPIRSISNLVSWCGDDYRFKIITGDRDSFENKAYEDIKINHWNTVGKAQVFYLGKENITPFYLLNLLKNTKCDFIYFNSFFRFQFSIMPLILLNFFVDFDLSRVLLGPRGEFSEGAIQLKSFKKGTFVKVIQSLGIYDKINWQATDKIEKEAIKKNIGVDEDKIYLIPNLPQKSNFNGVNSPVKKVNSLRIVYLSRVTPKKNLEFALKIIHRIPSYIDINFDIYGLRDDKGYWKTCKSIIAQMNDNVNVNYKGVIPHQEVLNTLAFYNLFFLPTSGENYGHAIYESLLAGTPVLISDQTPWQNLESKGMGWDVSLGNEDKFIEVIRKMGEIDTFTMKEIKTNVKNAIKKKDVNQSVQQNKKILKVLTHQ